jgi:hypothetical protein
MNPLFAEALGKIAVTGLGVLVKNDCNKTSKVAMVGAGFALGAITVFIVQKARNK